MIALGNVRLIYNPVSGQAFFKNNLDYIIERFQREGKQIIPYRTESSEDAFNAAFNLEEGKYEKVLVAGGDGTIHQAINGLMKRGIDVPVGIIPSGTANDVANYLGLPRTIKEICDTLIGENYIETDLGFVNNRYFINIASAGLLTDVSQKTEIAVKNNLGRLAYYLKGLEQLPKFHSINITLESPDYRYDGKVFLFLVMNGKSAGGFQKVAPLAQMDDGLLDVFLFKPASLPEIVSLFIKVVKGEHINSPQITYFQTNSLIIHCQEELLTDLDGEKGPEFPLEIKCLPKRLKILVP